MNTIKLGLVTVLLLATTACGSTMGERALIGGAATTPGLR